VRWFRRRAPDDDGVPGPPVDPDPVLPVLSRDDAATLVALTRRTFAEHGRETVPDGDGALVGDGLVHGLGNLAAVVAQLPRRQWPEAVARHVRTMIEAHATTEPATLEEARPLLLPKLRPLASLDVARPAYAPEPLPGILAVAALDYPTHVSELLSDERLDAFGGWSAVRDIAFANLRRLPAPHHDQIDSDPSRSDAVVHLLATDDFFGASRVLLLDEVLAGIGIERPAHGVLLAVPNRHLLAVHVLAGLGVVTALQTMVRLAAGEHDARPGPVSPQLFYRSADGRTQQVTRRTDGHVGVHVEGPLAEAFAALGLVE
jgi:hypothetical protein